MKKRYIYASLLSGLFFIILYVVLNFGLIISLLLTVGVYVGAIFFFKEKDVRKYDPNIIMHYCYLISKLVHYSEMTDDKVLSKNIKEITDEAERIIVMLEQKLNKVTQVYDSFDYFLPLTIKVVEEYQGLKNKEKLTAEELKFMNNSLKYLDNIELEFKKLLENMNYTKMLDINSSIEIFEDKNNLFHKQITGKED